MTFAAQETINEKVSNIVLGTVMALQLGRPQ